MSLMHQSSGILNTFKDGDSKLPGELVPMLDKPFHEEILPNIPSRPSLAQQEAVCFSPIAGNLGEKTNTQLATTSCVL